jgi:hypothetical protein
MRCPQAPVTNRIDLAEGPEHPIAELQVILLTLALVVGGTVAIFGIWALLALNASRKTQSVMAKFPNSVVLQAVAGSALRRVLDGWPDGPVLPLSFSVVADPSGVGFWGDAHTRLQFTNWRHVSAVRVVLVPERGRLTRGISLSIRLEGAERNLPIIVLGSGPLGAFPTSDAELRQVCERFDGWRESQI